MKNKLKVLGIGEVVLDKTNIVAQFLKEGYKHNSISTSFSIGGPVPVALILLSRLGVECSLICSIADDRAGEIIRKELKNEKVNIIPQLQTKTKTNLVLVNKKTASRTIVRDKVSHLPIKNISEKLIKSVDLIICDRHEKLAFDEIINKKKKSTPIVIDPSIEISKKTLKMIRVVSHPILPIESLYRLDKTQSLKNNLIRIQKIANKEIIITAGELGSLSFDGRKIKFVPPYDIKVVDTLGAGDVFRGAYSYGILNNWTKDKTLDFANLVSAMQCTKLGNSSAIPSMQEIRFFKRFAKYRDITLSSINNKLKGKLL